MTRKSDPGIENLLYLDGDRYFIDDKGRYEVIFKAKKVAVTPDQTHGLRYSLTLVDSNGNRLIGFDNAHPVRPTSGPSGKKRKTLDHRHIGARTRPYLFKDADTLVKDFWTAVDTYMRRYVERD